MNDNQFSGGTDYHGEDQLWRIVVVEITSGPCDYIISYFSDLYIPF
nr:MAG TPA: hypothetical protein [Caudoviricetes sp.]